MLAAVAKRAKPLAFFDDHYRSLASNSNKSKKKNIKKNPQFLPVCIPNSRWQCLETHGPLENVTPCLTSTNSILKAPCPSQLYKLDGESGNLLRKSPALSILAADQDKRQFVFVYKKSLKKSMVLLLQKQGNVRAVSMWSQLVSQKATHKKSSRSTGSRSWDVLR